MTVLSDRFRAEIDAHVADLRRRRAQVWPPGVPREVRYPLGEITLTAHLRHWARERGDRPAFVVGDRTLSYAQLDEQSDRLAAHLVADGVRPGDRVAVFMGNSLEFVLAFHAILKAGAVHVPVNPMFRGEEVRYELEDTGAQVAVVASALREVFESGRTDDVRTVFDETAIAEVVARDDLPGPGDDGDLDAGDLDVLAALNYTGGTTGLPKGCEHTQRHMLYTAASALTAMNTPPDDVSLVFLPIFWIAGEDAALLLPLVNGSTCVLMPRWDVAEAWDLIERHRVTTLVAPVDSWIPLLDRAEADGRDLSSLRTPLAVSFVTKLDAALRQRFTQVTGSPGILREAAFGMTETHTMDTFTGGLADRDLTARPIFCGLPVPGTDIVIVDRETGHLLPVGEEGEIAVRSPSLLTAYRGRPDATADVLQDGWLLTGDSGQLDESGCLSYLGRHKEMLKVNGMSVFPTEVEFLLGRHPRIAGAGVLGMPDPRTGERAVAFVMLASGATDTADDVVAWCRENMAPYKVPEVRLVDSLPLTATGKVIKRELADRLGPLR
ncbi:acyl-CoA synthetase [Geodermatophilus sp. DF01-2]|uniref:AMP-binding protein n=1 Tax=Geodermatophilus sp. DF01-2 TaxID=2559610 RepID=UPI001073A17F|nr:AMP-binding protein [Geodermatophilus sp. DF01_2]TFV62273.1 acyl-CoA synthetase [Geodermatophilus sp. DF01_2]